MSDIIKKANKKQYFCMKRKIKVNDMERVCEKLDQIKPRLEKEKIDFSRFKYAK